ncbi:hypothetical protein EVAR_56152_1 [Eumeta japonica]|uniref:Uncharacterized protein n=1 Tax=Eumeta variegata TaxID=151549 RepID=A0A4C1Y7S1_EUMVA|nr:hypothetical protein EVAR_56152_1 [Eumeta japonica]
MNISPREVTSALLASWVGIGYLMEGDWCDGRGMGHGTLTHRIKCTSYCGRAIYTLAALIFLVTVLMSTKPTYELMFEIKTASLGMSLKTQLKNTIGHDLGHRDLTTSYIRTWKYYKTRLKEIEKCEGRRRRPKAPLGPRVKLEIDRATLRSRDPPVNCSSFGEPSIISRVRAPPPPTRPPPARARRALWRRGTDIQKFVDTQTKNKKLIFKSTQYFVKIIRCKLSGMPAGAGGARGRRALGVVEPRRGRRACTRRGTSAVVGGARGGAPGPYRSGGARTFLRPQQSILRARDCPPGELLSLANLRHCIGAGVKARAARAGARRGPFRIAGARAPNRAAGTGERARSASAQAALAPRQPAARPRRAARARD